ncbi:hypothetical protein ONZ45_g3798 [Pleurotus djamor]|nr:hypothetical protein ONZ45_g3798 [Pleurotus djamor]
MSSRSAGGRRRQLKDAKPKVPAVPSQATPTPYPLPAPQHVPQVPVNHSQIYVQPYIQPSPDSYYQPFSHSVSPISHSPISISPQDDKRWFHHPSPGKDLRYMQPHPTQITPMRMSTPPSSPDMLTPTAMSFSSMSLSSASSTRSPAPTYQTISPTYYDPSSSPPPISPISSPYPANTPAPLLLQQPLPPLGQVATRTSGETSPQGFVYPTCRSGARPEHSPTAASFPKIKSKKKKGGDDKSTDDGRSEKSSSKDKPVGGRFRALLKRSKKKRTLTPIISETPTPLTPEPINILPESSSIQRNPSVESFAWLRKQDQLLQPYPHEAPYMQAYDPPFLENDQYLTTLLRRLTPRQSPSFHDYGRHPPAHVLDLGCGTGSWALEAATFWKAHGTRVTGFDLVDVAREEWGRARDTAAVQNLRFVRGNLLPFPDRTFDLVRMSNLTLCVPYSKWESVLGEVRRVMTINGRLELVDDQIVFPYARPSTSSDPPKVPVPAPRLDISIPSSSFNIPRGKDYEEDTYDDLDDVLGQEDSDVDEDNVSSATPTIAGDSDTSSRRSSIRQSSNGSIAGPGHGKRNGPTHPPSPWDRQAVGSQGLETVFENMLNERFHIHPRPSQFILDVMKRVFGMRHSSQMRNVHLDLAPTELHMADELPRLSQLELGTISATAAAASHSRGRTQDALSQCPGLMLYPSIFIPMPREEVEMHACKHIRTLLGCKAALADYVELRDNDGARVVDEEFWDAMFDFVRPRFEGIPRAPEARMDPSQAHARTESVETSDSASTYQESVLEYQSMFRNRFDLGNERSDTSAEQDSIMIASPTGVFQNYDGMRLDRSSAAPPYTPQELTHVRTIRVYEALKLSEEVLS